MKSGHAESNTPEKRLEPKNHPIEKENHLPNLHFLGSMLIFQGVYQVKAFLLKFRVFLARVLFSQFHHKLVAVKLPSHRNITQTNSFVPPIHLWIYYVYIYICTLGGSAYTWSTASPKKNNQTSTSMHTPHFDSKFQFVSPFLDITSLPQRFVGQDTLVALWRSGELQGLEPDFLENIQLHREVISVEKHGTWRWDMGHLRSGCIYIYIHIQKIKSFEIWNHLI